MANAGSPLSFVLCTPYMRKKLPLKWSSSIIPHVVGNSKTCGLRTNLLFLAFICYYQNIKLGQQEQIIMVIHVQP